MLTYELKKAPGLSLYESLYRCIREDILEGRLQPGQKLPSKRALCANLKVSKITVEGAYSQLLAEGYIRSEEKVGYFVEEVDHVRRSAGQWAAPAETEDGAIDLSPNSSSHFPFSVWSRLSRAVMQDMGEKLLQAVPNQGVWELRCAIAEHLAQFRGLQVDPEHILVGAGTDFLYNLLVQLLGRDKCYAVEEPGYGKIRKIYDAAGADCVSAALDRQGVCPEKLGKAQVLHISPSHHFPTGIVTPLARRKELLDWAGDSGWIIEDDYDSEFRFAAHPMPTMKAMDVRGRVIYMNTFSKSLAPSIRISYMVLPPVLLERFRESLGFYGCTVPSFEQYTLARFLQDGHFEKHINRMRKLYKSRRNQVLALIAESKLADKLTIREENAGLHFLVRVNTRLTDEELVQRCRDLGLRIRSLASYYHGRVPAEDRGCLVVNYSALSEEDIEKLGTIISQIKES